MSFKRPFLKDTYVGIVWAKEAVMKKKCYGFR